MRLIATWKKEQNVEIDNPVALRWEDGTTATFQDFARIDGNTQSDPDLRGSTVEFSYELR